MTLYRDIVEPEIVRQAARRSKELGFTRNCRPETGQLLAVLVAAVREGAVLEIGTGAGYGTAWMISTLRENVSLITVDVDQRLTDSSAGFFAGFPNVSVRCEGWQQPLGNGPFDLIFVDVSDAKANGAGAIVAALSTGGTVVIDDLTPVEQWPDEWRGKPDPVRDIWLDHPELVSTEIRVAPDHAVILGIKR